MLFIDPDDRKPYASKNEVFYNPSIERIDITVGGKPNMLYSHGLRAKDAYESAKNYFGYKDSDVSLGDFLTTKYCLWIDFRSSTDNDLHGSGTSTKNMSDAVMLHIKKANDGKGAVKCYGFVVSDAVLNIRDKKIVKPNSMSS